MKSKLTAGESTRGDRHPAARDVPIHALGVAGEGPRPSDPQRPICECCGQPLPAERACRCGCGRSLAGRRPNVRYALPACRTKRWRKPSQKRHGGASGLQISYAKAVRMLAVEFRLLNLPGSDARATELVRGMLSDRQRTRLDERGSPHG